MPPTPGEPIKLSKAQITEVKQKAEAGDAEAQNRLGDFMYDGIEGLMDKDPAKAFEWFCKSAEQGNPDACYSVGWAYLAGDGVEEKDFAKAAEWLEKAVDKGHRKAMRHLGRLYFMGEGVEKNYQKGKNLLTRAAELLDIESMALMGKLLMDGIEGQIEKDQEKAVMFLMNAAAAGEPESMHFVAVAYEKGQGVEKSEEKAKEWHARAEAAGYATPDTIFRIAVAHFQGTSGVQKDVAKAAALFKRAAEMGHGVAANNIARFFYFGTGVPQNYVQAYEWALKACRLGESDAGMTVGQCCEYGHGTIPDHQLAIQWYMHALNGDGDERLKPRLMLYLGRCYYKGGAHDGHPPGIPPNYEKAVYWFERSIAEGKVPDAYNLMGDMYFRGHGVKKDIEQAKKMWQIAAENGIEPAKEALHALENFSWKERLTVYLPTILQCSLTRTSDAVILLLITIVMYFVLKYKEMASESWFQKIQEIKLNDMDTTQEPSSKGSEAPSPSTTVDPEAEL